MAYKGKKESTNGRVDVRKRGPKISKTGKTLNQVALPLNQSSPRPVSSYNSGIKSGLYSNSLQNTVDISNITFSPLYTINTILNVSGQGDSWAREVVNNVVYPTYYNTLQAAISYSISFDRTEFINYVTTVSKALQLYYTYDSVIQYTANPNTQNIALEYLNEEISVDMKNALNLLRERLRACVIPPNIKETIRWMFQLYTASPQPGTPIYRFQYGGLWLNGQSTSGGSGTWEGSGLEAIKDMVQDLLDLTTSNTGAIMTQVFRTWVIEEITPSNNIPVYDPQWLTLYSNFNYRYGYDGTTLEWVNTQYEDTQLFHYQAFDNYVDGAVAAMSNIGTGTVDQATGTGLFNVAPLADIGAPKLTYCDRQYWDSSTNQLKFGSSLPEDQVNNLASVYPISSDGLRVKLKVVNPSCQLIMGMTETDLIQPTTDLIRFWYSTEEVLS